MGLLIKGEKIMKTFLTILITIICLISLNTDSARAVPNSGGSFIGDIQLKEYLCDVSGGPNDIAYYNGNKATIATKTDAQCAPSGTISSVVMCRLVVYKTNLTYRMRVQISVMFSAATRNIQCLTINGIAIQSPTYICPANVNNTSSGWGMATMVPGQVVSNNLYWIYPSQPTNEHDFSGEIILSIIPTWAYPF